MDFYSKDDILKTICNLSRQISELANEFKTAAKNLNTNRNHGLEILQPPIISNALTFIERNILSPSLVYDEGDVITSSSNSYCLKIRNKNLFNIFCSTENCLKFNAIYNWHVVICSYESKRSELVERPMFKNELCYCPSMAYSNVNGCNTMFYAIVINIAQSEQKFLTILKCDYNKFFDNVTYDEMLQVGHSISRIEDKLEFYFHIRLQSENPAVSESVLLCYSCHIDNQLGLDSLVLFTDRTYQLLVLACLIDNCFESGHSVMLFYHDQVRSYNHYQCFENRIDQCISHHAQSSLMVCYRTRASTNNRDFHCHNTVYIPSYRDDGHGSHNGQKTCSEILPPSASPNLSSFNNVNYQKLPNFNCPLSMSVGNLYNSNSCLSIPSLCLNSSISIPSSITTTNTNSSFAVVVDNCSSTLTLCRHNNRRRLKHAMLNKIQLKLLYKTSDSWILKTVNTLVVSLTTPLRSQFSLSSRSSDDQAFVDACSNARLTHKLQGNISQTGAWCDSSDFNYNDSSCLPLDNTVLKQSSVTTTTVEPPTPSDVLPSFHPPTPQDAHATVIKSLDHSNPKRNLKIRSNINKVRLSSGDCEYVNTHSPTKNKTTNIISKKIDQFLREYHAIGRYSLMVNTESSFPVTNYDEMFGKRTQKPSTMLRELSNCKTGTSNMSNIVISNETNCYSNHGKCSYGPMLDAWLSNELIVTYPYCVRDQIKRQKKAVTNCFVKLTERKNRRHRSLNNYQTTFIEKNHTEVKNLQILKESVLKCQFKKPIF